MASRNGLVSSSALPSPPPSSSSPNSDIVIGVLALQGAFLEHLHALRQLSIPCLEVRLPSHLSLIDGLIIPGGESTSIALVAQREQLLDPLRLFSSSRRPVFGTCAGLILLADDVRGQKRGGQQLIGGLDVAVQRNHYGTQLGSFRTRLRVPALATVGEEGGEECEAVFIRAPGIVEVGEGVEVLATIDKEDDALVSQQGRKAGEDALAPASADSVAAGGGRSRVDYTSERMRVVPVAVREGNLLATTFHPELTRELRWHALFADMVRKDKAARAAAQTKASGTAGEIDSHSSA